MIRSSGVGRGSESPPTFVHLTLVMLSSSNGRPARETSTATPLGLWLRRKTRDTRAKAMGFLMRGTKPNFAAAFRDFSQRSSPRSTRTSTSRVKRGRPSKETAIPPMISPGTRSDRNHLTRARSVASGGAVEALLATVCSQEPVPSLTDLSLPVGGELSPTKVPCPGCKCR